jgi:hypothetical protein
MRIWVIMLIGACNALHAAESPSKEYLYEITVLEKRLPITNMLVQDPTVIPILHIAYLAQSDHSSSLLKLKEQLIANGLDQVSHLLDKSDEIQICPSNDKTMIFTVKIMVHTNPATNLVAYYKAAHPQADIIFPDGEATCLTHSLLYTHLEKKLATLPADTCISPLTHSHIQGSIIAILNRAFADNQINNDTYVNSLISYLTQNQEHTHNNSTISSALHNALLSFYKIALAHQPDQKNNETLGRIGEYAAANGPSLVPTEYLPSAFNSYSSFNGLITIGMIGMVIIALQNML